MILYAYLDIPFSWWNIATEVCEPVYYLKDLSFNNGVYMK